VLEESTLHVCMHIPNKASSSWSTTEGSRMGPLVLFVSECSPCLSVLICICVAIYTHTYMYVNICIYICVCKYVCISVCVSVSLCVCMCVPIGSTC